MSEFAAPYTVPATQSPYGEPQALSARDQAIAAGAHVPQDYRPANDALVTINFKGETFHLDLRKWTFDVQDTFEQNMAMRGIRELFGEEQFARMKSWDYFDDFPAFAKLIQASRQTGK